MGGGGNNTSSFFFSLFFVLTRVHKLFFFFVSDLPFTRFLFFISLFIVVILSYTHLRAFIHHFRTLAVLFLLFIALRDYFSSVIHLIFLMGDIPFLRFVLDILLLLLPLLVPQRLVIENNQPPDPLIGHSHEEHGLKDVVGRIVPHHLPDPHKSQHHQHGHQSLHEQDGEDLPDQLCDDLLHEVVHHHRVFGGVSQPTLQHPPRNKQHQRQ